MANKMNNYFSSVFTIEQLNNVPQLGQYEGNMVDTFNFSTEEVQEKLQDLNTGPDMSHPRILRTLADKLPRPLANIFNNSVKTVIVPENWKSANVTAIYKKGRREEPGNYGPISLTSLVSKTMERLVNGRLITYLETNNQIGDSQHGFRNKRSWLTSLLDLFSQVIDTHDTNNNKAIDLGYLDFQKTFDKVPHERLMLEVNAHGIQGDAARWIRNWLAGRRQRVCINQSNSIWCTTRWCIRPTIISYLYK